MAAAVKQYLVDTFPSELGWIAIAARNERLAQLTFGHGTPKAAIAAIETTFFGEWCEGDWDSELIARLQAFAAGDVVDFSEFQIEYGQTTEFQQRIFEACRRIPYGQTLTYGQLASQAGKPRAARAVGNTMAKNQIPLVIPCHRVVPASQGIGGYSAGEGRRTKLRLLENEATTTAGTR